MPDRNARGPGFSPAPTLSPAMLPFLDVHPTALAACVSERQHMAAHLSDKQKLVVIGNGMAGARTVEEILARGGGEQFEITMFGDEPYGNYNRILLSNVLNGTQDPSDIFLNPLEWYTENNVTLHAPARVTHIDRARKGDSQRRRASHGLRQAADRDREPPFVPPMDGLETPDGGPQARRFRVPHPGRLPQDRRVCQQVPPSRRHRRRPAGTGSRPRADQLRR